MKRKIIKIDAEKCNGCGLCVNACHEGAIELIDGKAALIKDDYCDGLGDCLPVCPTNAITFEEREAAAYDEKAVKERMAKRKSKANTSSGHDKMPCGCSSTQARVFERSEKTQKSEQVSNHNMQSELMQFPIQIQLIPLNAPYFNGCDLLVAADCTAFAYGNFHQDLIKGKITIIGCPKLDQADYADKLTEILASNDINSITVARMEVPCCGGIVESVKTAIKNSGKILPWSIITITRDGHIK